VLAAPYAATVLRRLLPHRMAQLIVFDAAIHVAMIRGAVRYRTFIL
jgi:hypothetical protein